MPISELANYDPQENCEDCLECYGVIYEFTSCEEIEVCGPTNIMSNNNLYVGRDFVIDSSNNMFVPFFNSNILGKYDLTTQTFVEQSAQILSSPESVAIDEINGVICVTNTNYFPYPFCQVTFFDYSVDEINKYKKLIGYRKARVKRYGKIPSKIAR